MEDTQVAVLGAGPPREVLMQLRKQQFVFEFSREHVISGTFILQHTAIPKPPQLAEKFQSSCPVDTLEIGIVLKEKYRSCPGNPTKGAVEDGDVHSVGVYLEQPRTLKCGMFLQDLFQRFHANRRTGAFLRRRQSCRAVVHHSQERFPAGSDEAVFNDRGGNPG